MPKRTVKIGGVSIRLLMLLAVGVVAVSVWMLLVSSYLQAPPNEVREQAPYRVHRVPVYEVRACIEEEQWYPEPKTIEETFIEDNCKVRVRVENASGYWRIRIVEEKLIENEAIFWILPSKFHPPTGRARFIFDNFDCQDLR